MQSLLTARWPLALQQNKHSCIQQLQDVYLSVTNYGDVVGVPPIDGNGTSEFLDLSSVRRFDSGMTEAEVERYVLCLLTHDVVAIMSLSVLAAICLPNLDGHTCSSVRLFVCLSVCLSICVSV